MARESGGPGPSFEELFKTLIELAAKEADAHQTRSDGAVEHAKENNWSNPMEDENTGAYLHNQNAQIFNQTSAALETLYTQHRRSVERTMWPSWKNLSNKEIDQKIAEREQEVAERKQTYKEILLKRPRYP